MSNSFTRLLSTLYSSLETTGATAYEVAKCLVSPIECGKEAYRKTTAYLAHKSVDLAADGFYNACNLPIKVAQNTATFAGQLISTAASIPQQMVSTGSKIIGYEDFSLNELVSSYAQSFFYETFGETCPRQNEIPKFPPFILKCPNSKINTESLPRVISRVRSIFHLFEKTATKWIVPEIFNEEALKQKKLEAGAELTKLRDLYEKEMAAGCVTKETKTKVEVYASFGEDIRLIKTDRLADFSAFDLILPTLFLSLSTHKMIKHATYSTEYFKKLINSEYTVTHAYQINSTKGFRRTRQTNSIELIQDIVTHLVFSSLWATATYLTKRGIENAVFDASKDLERAKYISNALLLIATVTPIVFRNLSAIFTPAATAVKSLVDSIKENLIPKTTSIKKTNVRYIWNPAQGYTLGSNPTHSIPLRPRSLNSLDTMAAPAA